MSRGFTLIELVISIAIFVFMTALIVLKFGNFNQSTLLTDTAYEVALVLRTAQSYGLSVKNAGALGGSSQFKLPYGVDFDDAPAGNVCGQTGASNTSNASSVTLFSDGASGGVYDGQCTNALTPDAAVTAYRLTRGAAISSLCAGADASSCHSTGMMQQLDITFQRPNPDARICGVPSSGGSFSCGAPYQYAEITVMATDGSTRLVTVRGNGQISVPQ